jgi:hypothetical protein
MTDIRTSLSYDLPGECCHSNHIPNYEKLRVLVACEYSGAVRNAFRELGHEAWSCDLLPSVTPGLHYQGDVRHILDGWTPVRHQCECDPDGEGWCKLTDADPSDCQCIGPTQDDVEYIEIDGVLFGRLEERPTWDLMVAHPPCTYLCSSGLHWNKRRPERAAETEKALDFVRLLLDAPIPHIALENPIGCISTRIRPPTQTIQPWQFGHPESKATCLWLKNLLPLVPNQIMQKPICGYWDNQTPSRQNKLGPSADRWKARSATYSGIASAMAQQWSSFLTREIL